MNKLYLITKCFVVLVLFSLTFNTINAQYCEAGVGPTSTADSQLTDVILNGDAGSAISNTGLCPGIAGVSNYLAQTVNVTAGGSYNIALTFGTCGGDFGGFGAAWIDWNLNFQFDASELISTWTGTPTETVNWNFTVPADACDGATRLRVMQQEGGAVADPCASFTWGSVQDYTIIVTGGDANCQPPTLGCTDACADNYDPNADIDDGSCNAIPQPDCTSPAVGTASNDCANAPLLSDFEGVCGDNSVFTPSLEGDIGTAFCGSIENNGYVSFIPEETTYSVKWWIYDCDAPGNQLQFEVFTVAGTCTNGDWTSFPGTCQSPAGTDGDSGSIELAGLTPGQLYYIMIDGFAGDTCNFAFAGACTCPAEVGTFPAGN